MPLKSYVNNNMDYNNTTCSSCMPAICMSLVIVTVTVILTCRRVALCTYYTQY